MKNLNQILRRASDEGWAVGHFNVANLEMLKAVVYSAKKLSAPVMIGTSEGERDWLGLTNIVALINSMREEYPYIYLNADHTKSVSLAEAATRAGYDSIHFDGSKLNFEENVTQTKEVVDFVRETDSEISVEGELGYVKGESQKSAQKIILTPADYTDPAQAVEFVKATAVDRLAIAVGNIHGINADEPRIDLDRIAVIRQALPETTTLVLHAGSGIADEVIKSAIVAGISNIHISTELRIAFREGLAEALKNKPDEYAPYKLYAEDVEALEAIISSKIELFGGAGRMS